MKWISVKERLPEFEETVWLWHDDEWTYGHLHSIEKTKSTETLKWYNEKYEVWNEIFLVTHWMPLPEPPKHQ